MKKFGLGFNDNGLFDKMREARLSKKHAEQVRKTKEIEEAQRIKDELAALPKQPGDFETEGEYLMYLFHA